MPVTKTRLWYLDYLRILSAFFIVVLHVCASVWCSGDVHSFGWHTVNAFSLRFPLPIFFMISGALFLDPSRPLSIKRLYTGNILRIVIAYLFWTLLFTVSSGSRSLGTILDQVLNPYRHTWFLMVLAGCYMMVPVFRKLTESPSITKYFLLFFLLHNLRGDIQVLLSAIPSPYFQRMSQWLQSAASLLQLKTTLGYAGHFVLGYYLHQAELKKRTRTVIYILGAASYILSVSLTAAISLQNGIATSTRATDNFTTLTTLQAAAFFLLIKHSLGRFSPKGKWEGRVQQLSKITFGIYLVHMPIVNFLEQRLHLNALFVNPLIAVPVLSLSVFLISALVSWVLNKIPIVRKYLV